MPQGTHAQEVGPPDEVSLRQSGKATVEFSQRIQLESNGASPYYTAAHTNTGFEETHYPFDLDAEPMESQRGAIQPRASGDLAGQTKLQSVPCPGWDLRDPDSPPLQHRRQQFLCQIRGRAESQQALRIHASPKRDRRRRQMPSRSLALWQRSARQAPEETSDTCTGGCGCRSDSCTNRESPSDSSAIGADLDNQGFRCSGPGMFHGDFEGAI